MTHKKKIAPPISFAHLKKSWNKSYILRRDISQFTEGLLSGTHMATLDCRKQGPERFMIQRSVAYDVDIFIDWMEQKLVSRVDINKDNSK